MANEAPLRILLVEDDVSIARVIAIGLRLLGKAHVIDQATSAEDALELWEQQPYDLVLTDYNLRGMNGIALVTHLRNRHSAVPAVLFTAYDTPQIRRKALDADVSAFIAKPFVIEDFVELARSLLPERVRAVGA